jgi:hypothetical protein
MLTDTIIGRFGGVNTDHVSRHAREMQGVARSELFDAQDGHRRDRGMTESVSQPAAGSTHLRYFVEPREKQT